MSLRSRLGRLLIQSADKMVAVAPAMMSPVAMREMTKDYFKGTKMDWIGSAEDDLVDSEIEILRRTRIENGHVLVLGCGAGREVFGLVRRGFEVTGVEQSAEMVDFAGRYAREHGLEAQFEIQDFADLRLQGVYDHALFFNFAYCFIPGKRNRIAVLERLKRWVRPGGLCLINFLIVPLNAVQMRKIGYLEKMAPLLGNPDYEAGDRIIFRRCYMHYFPSAETVLAEAQAAGWKARQAVPVEQAHYAILENA